MPGTNFSKNLETQPYIFQLLSAVSLLIAKDIRNDFLNLTDNVTSKIRDLMLQKGSIIKPLKVKPPEWKDLKGEIACFIDGGVGQTEFFTKIPLIIRSGIFKVITGERDLNKRENFQIYPILVGDLEDVNRESDDYIAVTRIIIELLSAFKVIEDEEYAETNFLLLHGPLVYRMSQYSPHYLGEADLKRVLGDPDLKSSQNADTLIKNFRDACQNCSIRAIWCQNYENIKRMRAICLIKYILKRIFTKIKKNSNQPLTYSVVERSKLREYCKEIIFKELLKKDPKFLDNFNIQASGNKKNDIKNLLKKTNYHDALLLSLILEEGEYTEPFEAIEVFSGYKSDLSGIGEILKNTVAFKYSYLKIKQNLFPIRIEFPAFLNKNETKIIMNRAFKYSKLLPNYAFPIGLDIVDKFAKVPQWMTNAFRKLISIRLNIEASNESADIFRRMMNIVFLSDRDWQHRPTI